MKRSEVLRIEDAAREAQLQKAISRASVRDKNPTPKKVVRFYYFRNDADTDIEAKQAEYTCPIDPMYLVTTQERYGLEKGVLYSSYGLAKPLRGGAVCFVTLNSDGSDRDMGIHILSDTQAVVAWYYATKEEVDEIYTPESPTWATSSRTAYEEMFSCHSDGELRIMFPERCSLAKFKQHLNKGEGGIFAPDAQYGYPLDWEA